ncbi:LacI family DNA-binding transcriptional regulator [Thalassotalea sp. 1_MG-2023]|uniref:LacI family DNA-binding transcriptional regulator n=1 Tax=Thalassotalea sp. 1_MG-2023 TaxID=3062680 RepID=UPI0026E168F4|nr:LacI family DNA-binding transcriptional regulator [Thalassotalea sp. 1_MG-2023]MDO6428597.1 LacI family DNA-binding transcriptional regulator [Thalassotalea sp. 1_MG-2023]
MMSKATSFDIAYRAGVSQSTVSRALRNSPLVNEETRQKVQAIARELNYKVDKHASSLRTQQSNTIALLLFEDPTNDDSLINPFFLSMLGSITRACAQKGYDLLVSFQQLSDDWHADYEDSKKADGLILLGYGDFMDYEEKLNQLSEQNTHFVRWGAKVDNERVLSVGCDNVHGGYQVTEHVIKQGKKMFAFLGDASTHSPEFLNRYHGYCQALTDNKLTVESKRQIDAISVEDSGYDAACQLINSGVDFDAIFGASDLIAIGAMRALQEHGYKIPEQVAVVGFDDIAISSFTIPSLTTAKQDTKLAGELLVDNLIALINGESPEDVLMPTTLIVRKSCGS